MEIDYKFHNSQLVKELINRDFSSGANDAGKGFAR
jgi:hypothetical protein